MAIIPCNVLIHRSEQVLAALDALASQARSMDHDGVEAIDALEVFADEAAAKLDRLLKAFQASVSIPK